jgi:hypothetical protein
MKKRVTAALLTVLLICPCAVPTITAGAESVIYYDVTGNKLQTGVPYSYFRYATDNVYGDGYYWYPNMDAYNQYNSGIPPFYTRKPTTAYSADRFCYFDSSTGSYVEESQQNRDDVYYISKGYVDESGEKYTSYLAGDGFYYPTQELAKAHTSAKKTIGTITRYGEGTYFSIYTGSYYENYSNALSASAGNASYIMLLIDDVYYDYRYTPIYQNMTNHKYYLSREEAEAAYKGSKVTSSGTPTQGYYFNRATGRFYATKEAAAMGGFDKDVVAATSLAYSNGIFNYGSGESIVPSYYEGLYNPNYNGIGEEISAQNGDAHIAGNVSYAGWDAIMHYIENTREDAVISIDMNEQLTVPREFLSAVKGFKRTLVFINENGSRLTVKTEDIIRAKAVDIGITYGTTYVTASEIKKYSTDALSSSQFKIGDGNTFGFTGKLTIKFNKSRSGKTVRLYRSGGVNSNAYRVDTSVISSDGTCSFDYITAGGNYFAIIVK